MSPWCNPSRWMSRDLFWMYIWENWPTYLRLLGFDALYRNDYDDDELAHISSEEKRILLTQDRGLLKRSKVTYGYSVRSDNPEEQTVEVLQKIQPTE